MNRFMLFCGSTYYAAGGWKDFEGSFETIMAAKSEADRQLEQHAECVDWYQIVDSLTGAVVEQSAIQAHC